MAFGMTLINGPIPNLENLAWDSSDLNGDYIPMQESQKNPDILWWCIHIEENATRAIFNEMLQWNEENCQYQSGLRYDEIDPYIIGYFRHPDDAFAFKLTWT